MGFSRYAIFIFLLAITIASTLSLNAQTAFPDKCLGIWGGTMYLQKDGAITDSVRIKFTVAKTDSPDVWTWKTEYLSPTRPMVKDYTIKLIDKEKQHYVTDENNGIVLSDYRFGDKLYSIFETAGILLTASYELIGEQLIFEVTSGKKLAADSTQVTNYSVNHLQRVVLSKIE